MCRITEKMQIKVPALKRMQVDYPELVGKTIFQKWGNGDEECWHRRKVIKALGDINLEDCEF